MPIFDPGIFDPAIFDAGDDHGFTLDAVLLDTQVGSFTLDAVLKRGATGAFTLDAAVIGGAVGSATLDAVLFREATGSATIDAVLAAVATTQSGSFTFDAVVQSDLPLGTRTAPRFLGSGTVGANAGGFTGTYPSSSKPGDLLLLVVHTSNQAYTTPAGWTLAPNSPQTIGTAGAAGAVGLYVFYRFRGTDNSVAITDSGDHQIAHIYAFRGVDRANPFNTSAGGTTASSTALSATGVTTTVDNTRLVFIAADAIDSGADQLGTSFTNADVTGFIRAASTVAGAAPHSTIGTGGGWAIATGLREVAGTIGATTGTFPTATNQAFLTLALAPSATPWMSAVGGRFDAGAGVNATAEWPTNAVTQSGVYEAGDLGILVVETAGSEVVAAPSGWTALTTPNESGATVATDTRLSLLYRRSLTNHESPVTVTNPGNHLYTKILTFANVVESGDPVNASSSNVNSTATTSKSVTGLTTTIDNTLVLSFVAWANDSSGPLATNTSWANASLDLDGEIDDQGTNQGNGGGVAIASGRDFVAGSVGATTATFTSSISAHQMVALLRNPTLQKSFTLDAELLDPLFEGSFTLDAFISEPFTTVADDFTLDSILFRLSSATATLDAILFETSSASITLDAITRTSAVGSFTFDAEKVFTTVASWTFDATFFGTTSTLFYLRAFIENGDAAEWEDREDEEQNGGPGGPGAGDGPKALPIIRIWANGVDIAPDVMFQDAQFTTLVNGGIGQFSFRVRDTAKVKDFTTGMEVAVDINGIRRFGGYATLVTRLYTFPAVDTSDLDRTDRFWRISGVDYNILFAKRILYDHANPANVGLRTWPAGSASDTVIRYVISNYTDLLDDGITLDLVENVGSPNPDKIGVIGSGGLTAGDAMREINRLISGVWYIDPYKQLVYTDVDTPNASKGLTDHPTIGTQVGYRDFNHVENGAGLVNDAMVWGAGQGSTRVAFARSTDATSISQHGRWQFGEFTTALYKQVSVNERASTIVYGTDQSKRGGKDDQVSWTATTFDHDFTVGQKVAIESDTFGVSDVVPIRRYTLTFPTTTAPQYQLVLSHEIDEPWNFFEFYFPPFPAFDFDIDINIPPIVLPPPVVEAGCNDDICGITDTFTRTEASDWGTSDAGVAWIDGSFNASTSVEGTYGRLFTDNHDGSDFREAYQELEYHGGHSFSLTHRLRVVSFDDSLNAEDAYFASTNGGTYWVLENGSFFTDPGQMSLRMGGWPGGGTLGVDEEVISPFALDLDVWHMVRWEVEYGVASRLKIWVETDPEPDDWTLEVSLPGIVVNPPSGGELSFDLFSPASGAAVGEFEVHIAELDIEGVDACSHGFFDNFERSVAPDGWGTSSSGYTWTVTESSGDISVTGGNGRLALTTFSGVEVALLAPPSFLTSGNNIDMHTAFRTNLVSGSNNQNQLTFEAWNGAAIFAVILGNSDGGIFIDTNQATLVFVAKTDWVANAWYEARWQQEASGAARARVWPMGDPEPSTWDVELTGGAPTVTQNYFLVDFDTGGGAGGGRVDIAYLDFDYTGRPCRAGTLVGEPQTFLNRSWVGSVRKQRTRDYHAITGEMIQELEQHARLYNLNPDFDSAEAFFGDHASALDEYEHFHRHFIRHTAPEGATHAVLRLRMYAESFASQAHMNAVGVQNTPWQIWTWAGPEWTAEDSGVDMFPPVGPNPGPPEAVAAYGALDTLLASGSLITDGSDGVEAELNNDNDYVEVDVPVVDGEVRIAFAIPETIGVTNATYSDPSGDINGNTTFGVLAPRYPNLRDEVFFDLSFPQHIEDAIFGGVAVRAALQDVNGFSEERYELFFYNADPSGVAPAEGSTADPITGPGRHEDDGDGAQTVFQLNRAFVPGSTRVYVNGLFQRPGGAREYTEQASAGTITFNDPPPNGASIQIFYEAAGSL